MTVLPLSAVLWLVVIHFVADFLLQSDRIAINKSKSNPVLAWHVTLYVIPFFAFGLAFMAVNWVAHFVTDWISSRIASYCWRREQRHWFFVTIGADQAIHLITLFTTYALIVA